MQDKPRQSFRPRFHPVYLCLLLPFVADVWEPSYNHADPALFGIPFFYWWQTLWIGLGALCVLPVYLFEEKRPRGETHK